MSRGVCTETPRWVNECSHTRCPKVALPAPPPPPKPLEVDDGFEDTPVGAHPAHATVSGEEHGASIVVSDERAAAGKRSLKITDSKTLLPAWQPHFYYEPHITEGVVRQSFDIWLQPDAEFLRSGATRPIIRGTSGRACIFPAAEA